MKKKNWYIIGAGAVGSTLARALVASGEKLSGICVRRPINISERKRYLASVRIVNWPDLTDAESANQIVIATADRDIASTAEQLARSGLSLAGKQVFHLSGTFDSELLKPLKNLGACTGSLHFMQSFSSRFLAPHIFKNITFAGEGDDKCLQLFTRLTQLLGGHFLQLKPGKKTFYHISAVACANFLTGLLNYAGECLEEAGVDQDKTADILLPIAKTVIDNFQKQGAMGSLTGPLQRGDRLVIETHISQLSQLRLDLLPLYAAFSKYLLEHVCAKDNDSKVELDKVIAGAAGD